MEENQKAEDEILYITEPAKPKEETPIKVEEEVVPLEEPEAIVEEEVEEIESPVSIHKRNKDEFNILSEGERANPYELLDDGNIDLVRLGPGACFGELALIDGKPRMATIKCLTRCHFLILNRDDYNKSLREQDKKQRQIKVDIIWKIPIF